MFSETKESKSDSDRLRQSSVGESTPTSPTTTSSPSAPGESSSSAATALATKIINSRQHNHQNNVMQSKTSYLAGKQQAAATALHQHYLNYFNSNIPKEETKSQQRTGNGLFAPQDHASQMNHSNANQRSNHNTNSQQLASGSGNHIYKSPCQMLGPQAHTNLMPRSSPRDESPVTQRLQQLQQQQQQQQQNFYPRQHPPQVQPANMTSRSHSTGALSSSAQQQHQTSLRSAMHYRQEAQQQDRDSEETTTTTIKEELENDLQGCKTSELEAISSLERNLPIELTFLIRQQAHCMARMNYLDRQIRELKEAAQCQQQVDSNQVSSTSIFNPGHINRPASNIVNAAKTMPHTKNGNFILSDDSGGEYSRATLSDDDELSSLLDQIAKSVRPERASGSSMISNNYGHLQQQQQQHQQQQQQRLANNCGTLMSNKQQAQQPYAIFNANQLHHQQAVPIFVMGSPIAVAHPSSINSNILPGVHFQPEPRYNQYYEDFCYGSTLSPGLATSMINAPTMAVQKQSQNHHQNGHRAQQFDNSISVIEQLVSQREKRQIMSQLKSADNWLKMRSSNQDSSIRTMGGKQQQQQQASISRQLSGETQAQELDGQQSDIKR